MEFPRGTLAEDTSVMDDVTSEDDEDDEDDDAVTEVD
jgi:hypothetical protein